MLAESAGGVRSRPSRLGVRADSFTTANSGDKIRLSAVTVAQLVRAPDCGSGGRGFKPRQSPLTQVLWTQVIDLGRVVSANCRPPPGPNGLCRGFREDFGRPPGMGPGPPRKLRFPPKKCPDSQPKQVKIDTAGRGSGPRLQTQSLVSTLTIAVAFPQNLVFL